MQVGATQSRTSASSALVVYNGSSKDSLSQRATVGALKKKNILVDFDGTEEDREKDSIRIVLQKYTTLFRFLFDKYTIKHDLHKKANATRNRAISEKVITISDLMKLFRDHNMDHSMLNKHEFQMLMS